MDEPIANFLGSPAGQALLEGGRSTLRRLRQVAANVRASLAPPDPNHQLGSDPSTNPKGQHATQVEPSSATDGKNTIIAACQGGRIFDGGCDLINVATTTDGGKTYVSGVLPGITKEQGGKWDRVSDVNIAYNAKAGMWLASSLAILEQNGTAVGAAIIENRSKDGITWEPATSIIEAPAGSFFDKNWIACDNNPGSPHFGNTYLVFDDNGQQDLVQVMASSDVGATWSTPQATPDQFHGLGGEPVVQPNGNVVIPMVDGQESSLWSVILTNGGTTVSAAKAISDVQSHKPGGNLRSGPLPSVAMDANGRVYVVWQDSRFQNGNANDMVLSMSDDGSTWSTPVRIPTGPAANNVDRAIPALAVDSATGGDTAHISLSYYTVTAAGVMQPEAVASVDGGKTFSNPTVLGPPFPTTSAPDTSQGRMVGDYAGNTIVGGKAFPVFCAANQPPDGKGHFDVSMHSPFPGLDLAAMVKGGVTAVQVARPGLFNQNPVDKLGTIGDLDF
ncbi:MAG: sialidase family protein [Candidatus Dormibacteria bacterium]